MFYPEQLIQRNKVIKKGTSEKMCYIEVKKHIKH